MRGAWIAVLVALPSVLGLPLLDNPWLNQPGPLFISHQGGETEYPSNTLFAFKESARLAAEAGLSDQLMLELDVHRTQDGHLVVLHDATVDRTTDGSGRVDTMSLEQLQRLDAAYWMCPGLGPRHDPAECPEYAWRGVATGHKAPPAGYGPDDFVIPTLASVFETFPATPINIEIKDSAPTTVPFEIQLADLIRAHGRQADVLVGSFLDHSTEVFKTYAPEIGTYYATGGAASFWATSQGPAPGSPNRHEALEVPITFEGIPVMSEDFVRDAHSNNIAVYVWTIGDCATMDWLAGLGVDGIMTDRPSVLANYLASGNCP